MSDTALLKEDLVPVTSTENVSAQQNSSKELVKDIEQHSSWSVASRLPVTVSTEIPLNVIKVQELLMLTTGQVFLSKWSDTEDVPLVINCMSLGWGEFEVVEQQLGIRLTRLA